MYTSIMGKMEEYVLIWTLSYKVIKKNYFNPHPIPGQNWHS